MPAPVRNLARLLQNERLVSPLGEWLLKLGNKKSAYELPPPSRVTGVDPDFGFGPQVYVPGGGLNEYSNAYQFSKHPKGGFFKYYLTRDKALEDYADRLPPGGNISDEVTALDAMRPSKLGGAAEYQQHWLDDLRSGRDNFSAFLTDSNLIRRPINQLSFQVRNPEASNVLLYKGRGSNIGVDEVYTPLPSQVEFMNMSPESRVGWLGVKTASDLLNKANPEARELVLQEMGNPSSFDIAMRNAAHLERDYEPRSPFGLQSMRRSSLILNALQDLDRGAFVDDLVAKYNLSAEDTPLFKKYGGLV